METENFKYYSNHDLLLVYLVLMVKEEITSLNNIDLSIKGAYTDSRISKEQAIFLHNSFAKCEYIDKETKLTNTQIKNVIVKLFNAFIIDKLDCIILLSLCEEKGILSTKEKLTIYQDLSIDQNTFNLEDLKNLTIEILKI